MPPKSLQPSAVVGTQTPCWVFNPKQDASFDPRANSLKLPALRAVVIAHNAETGVRALSRFLVRPRKLPQNCRKRSPAPADGVFTPPRMRKPHTGAYSGQQREFTHSARLREVCNPHPFSQPFLSLFELQLHVPAAPAVVHSSGRWLPGLGGCDTVGCCHASCHLL